MMKDTDFRKMLETIGAHAAQDGEFRKQLLRDPHAAIRRLTGTQVPDKLRIKFVEKDPGIDMMIVLPDLVTEDCELTEEDIENVAGGTDWGCQDDSTA
jgi:hypothetical protein